MQYTAVERLFYLHHSTSGSIMQNKRELYYYQNLPKEGLLLQGLVRHGSSTTFSVKSLYSGTLQYGHQCSANGPKTFGHITGAGSEFHDLRPVMTNAVVHVAFTVLFSHNEQLARLAQSHQVSEFTSWFSVNLYSSSCFLSHLPNEYNSTNCN